MLEMINWNSPEHRKSSVLKLLCQLFSKAAMTSVFPSSANQEIQNHMFLLLRIELKLRYLYVNNRPKYADLFRDLPSQGQMDFADPLPPPLAIKTPSEWTSVDVSYSNDSSDNFLFLKTYRRLTQADLRTAVKELANRFDLSFVFSENFDPGKLKIERPSDYYVYDDIGNLITVFRQFSCDAHEFELPMVKKDFSEFLLPLFNLNLIQQNPQAVVFLLNSISLAEKIENVLSEKHKEKIVEELSAPNKMFVDWLTKSERTHEAKVSARLQWQGISPRGIPGNGEYFRNLQNKNAAYIQEFCNAWNAISDFVETNVVFSAYYGNGDTEDMKLTDLSALKGHPVYLFVPCVEDEKSWITQMLPRINLLSQVDAGPIFFIKTADIIDSLNTDSGDMQIISSQEIILRADELGMDLQYIHPRAQKEAFREKKKSTQEDFLIDNILDRRSMLLISAQTGVGKSIFAMNLGFALATKGKLINQWAVKERCKVLYVCDLELDERTYLKHQEKFKKLYNIKGDECDFIYMPVSGWRLQEKEFRNKLENAVDAAQGKGISRLPVSVVILDNLNRLAPGVHQEANWEDFSLWLTSLLQKDLSIILVHHSSKDKKSEYLGTSKIQNDVDVYIHLEADEENITPGCIPLKMYIKKNRRSWLDRKAKKLTLAWEKTPQWYDEEFKLLNWRDRNSRVSTINKLRKEGMTAKEIAARYNVKPKTLEGFIYNHPDEIEKVNEKRKKGISVQDH